MLGQHYGVRVLPVAQHPQSVLEAPNRFPGANVDIFKLCRPGFHRVPPLLQQFRKSKNLVAVLLVDTDEVLGDTALSELVVERFLQIGLLTQWIRPRSGNEILRTGRSKVAGQTLKQIPFRRLLPSRRILRGLE